MSEEKWLDKFDLSEEEKKDLIKQLKEKPEIRPDLINLLSVKLLNDEDRKEKEYRKKKFRKQLLFLIPVIMIFLLLFFMLKYHQNIVERPTVLLDVSFKLLLPISIAIGIVLGHRFYKNNKEKIITSYLGSTLLSICAFFAIPMFSLDTLARVLPSEPWSKIVTVEKTWESSKSIRLRHSSLCKKNLRVVGIRKEKLPTDLCLDILGYNEEFNEGEQIVLVGRKTILGVVVDSAEK